MYVDKNGKERVLVFDIGSIRTYTDDDAELVGDVCEKLKALPISTTSMILEKERRASTILHISLKGFNKSLYQIT